MRIVIGILVIVKCFLLVWLTFEEILLVLLIFICSLRKDVKVLLTTDLFVLNVCLLNLVPQVIQICLYLLSFECILAHAVINTWVDLTTAQTWVIALS